MDTREIIDSVIVEIMEKDGPDGHIDGHDVIVDYIESLLLGTDKEWHDDYRNGKYKRNNW